MWSIFFKKVVFPAGAHSCFYKYQSFEHLKMEVSMWSVVISGRLRISKRAEMNSDSPTSPLPTSQLTVGVWINSTASICASICSNSSHWFKKRRIRRIWVLRDVILSLSSSASYTTTRLLTPPWDPPLKKDAHVVASKPWCLTEHPPQYSQLLFRVVLRP